jgi:hypothetical protein
MGWLACAFIVIAIIFALIPMGSGIPITEPVSVSKEDIATTPRFTTMGDDAMAVVAGFKRNCMDCHEIIDGKPRNEDLLQHKNIHMDHGLNGRCINCHDPKDRDKLILRDGKNVGYSQSPLLCAQCHGTTYRQWQRKVHGKTLGYWDSSKGEAKTLLCVECHNPHSPRYAPMTPLPAPNTLRMGDQSGGVHHEEGDKRSPLSPDYGSHRRHQKSQPTGH